VWLGAEGAIVMIEPASPGERVVWPGEATEELVAFAILPGERAAARARLARHDVAIEAETPFTLYFRDPDGRRVGLSHYPELEPVTSSV
jgi:hypothetical protein